MISIYLIRHAESYGNLNNHLIGGQSNHLQLTERGQLQALKLGQRLKEEGFQFDRVYASHAVRAQHTAQIACEALGFSASDIVGTDALLELSQGEWEGQERALIYTPERKAEVAQNSLDFTPPGGESQREVYHRMRAWLDQVAEEFQGVESANIAAFSHGFAIRTLIGQALEANPLLTRGLMIHNTSISCMQAHDGRWMYERINDFAHLAGMEMIGHYG
ncbi:histidine phosphatase family protein [Pontibacter sp. G13]|uniref:histidine phosphatase family protein n=1 Tax=Pontibacter sp. G13 TaxID=3074898 RepID=UPI00288B4BE4|nr:histidine phosphatase family protein [Pontibacter sp. G13]WNJ17642.1 histidine phosphatase family protein [Pontibacter sp. G13]